MVININFWKASELIFSLCGFRDTVYFPSPNSADSEQEPSERHNAPAIVAAAIEYIFVFILSQLNKLL